MKYKKIMFMLVLAILIFGVSSVCASDVNDTVSVSEDDSSIELSQADAGEMISCEEDELISKTRNVEFLSDGNSGTFAELQANITAAEAGSTLTLNKNYEYEDGFDTNGIHIDKSITIDGNGFKIDGKKLSRIFQITADNVILKNIIFTNGSTTENGGALYFQKSGSLTNCNFTYNKATSDTSNGAAVYFSGKGTLTVCAFNDNSAINGAAVYFSGEAELINCDFTDNAAKTYGGAVYFSGKGTLIDCAFKDNSASSGGAVYFNGAANLTDCNFTANSATDNGGAIRFSSTGTVANCNFVDNKATGDFSTGGAVYFAGNGEVTNSNFINNTASQNGGAVYLADGATGSIINSEFNKNIAKMGNAIYINSNHCTISGSDFTNNPITEGAIHSVSGGIDLSNNILNADDFVSGRNFTELQNLIDRANEGDEITIDGLYEGFGIPITINKTLTLVGRNNLTLDANKLSKIFYISANNVILKNIEFTNGYAENGGAVYFSATGNVTNCNFTSNEVAGAKSGGGAIYFNATGNVIDSIFTDNKASRNGGAIYVEAQSTNNNFSSQFYNNYAGQSGGAIFFHNLVQNDTFESIFKDNYAGYGGGMFFSKGANANTFNSDFINNTGKSCGGAMFFYSTTDKNNFTGSYINNSALGQIDPTNGNGGAITFKNVATNSVFTCDFINNTASLNGGAVNYRQTPQNITFNSNFINNTSPSGGGVNFFETFVNVIFNGEFIENSAENGGAIAAKYGAIENVSFKNNSAKHDGGAVYFAQSGEAINCNFTNNHATHSGGAVYISEKGNVANCSFEDNYASYNGGALYSKFGAVDNSNFTANTAKNDGGAVYLSYPSNVSNCSFEDNSANDGGALYFLNDNDNVINCSFVANEASNRGGALFFMTKDQVNITNSYFEGNSAPEGGASFCYTWAVTADSCIFKNDSDTTNNTLILAPSFDVHDFYSVYGSGEKLTFNLTTNSGMEITDGKISMTIYPKGNDKSAVNRTCLSGEGWVVDLPVGSYYAVINTEYKGLEPLIRNIEIAMPDVNFYINVTSITSNKKNVNITAKSNIPENLLWDGKVIFVLANGTEINGSYAADGNWWAEYTFDGYGEYEVTAIYEGLDNVNVNNGTITINITDSTITIDDVEMDYGDSINVTPICEGAAGITAKIDDESVSVDEFTIPISGLKAGVHNLTVTTVPDEGHTAVSKTVTVTVNKVNSTLTVEDLEFDYNTIGNTTVSYEGASGVEATINGHAEAKIVIDGNTISVSGLDSGKYTLSVRTIPDENHTAVTKESNVTINKIITEITVNNLNTSYKAEDYLIASLKDGEGNPIAGAELNVYLGGKFSYITDANGQIKVPTKDLLVSRYDAVIIYGGDKNHDGSDANTYVVVNRISTKIIFKNMKTTAFESAIEGRVGDYFNFQLVDEYGTPLANKPIQIGFNGKVYNRTTNATGGAQLQINLKVVNLYTFAIAFLGDDNYEGSFEVALINVTAQTPKLTSANKSYKATAKTKSLTATLKSTRGKAIVGKKVTFTVNGKTYTAKTNSKGIATVNVSLNKKGTYSFTVKFAGDKTYNAVSKKGKLTIK